MFAVRRWKCCKAAAVTNFPFEGHCAMTNADEAITLNRTFKILTRVLLLLVLAGIFAEDNIIHLTIISPHDILYYYTLESLSQF